MCAELSKETNIKFNFLYLICVLLCRNLVLEKFQISHILTEVEHKISIFKSWDSSREAPPSYRKS